METLHESKLNKNLILLFGYKSTWKISEAYLQPLQTSKMELKDFNQLTKSSILDVCNGSKYTSGYNYL